MWWCHLFSLLAMILFLSKLIMCSISRWCWDRDVLVFLGSNSDSSISLSHEWLVAFWAWYFQTALSFQQNSALNANHHIIYFSLYVEHSINLMVFSIRLILSVVRFAYKRRALEKNFRCWCITDASGVLYRTFWIFVGHHHDDNNTRRQPPPIVEQRVT